MIGHRRHWLVAMQVTVIAATLSSAYGADRIIGPANPISLSYFGMHMHRQVAFKPGDRRANWPDIPFGSWRLWDAGVQWRDIEKSRGQSSFMVLDAYVNMAQYHGVDLLYTFGGTPQWASARPDEPCAYGKGCAAEPRDLGDWESYVGQVVQRYKGRIKFYELWNEPKFEGYDWDARVTTSFFTGTLRDFFAMADIARRVIREFDPNARLLGPGDVGDGPRMEVFIKEGGARYLDVASFHFYSPTPESIPRKFRTLKEALGAAGVGNMPFWNTEMGYDRPRQAPVDTRNAPRDLDEHAGYVARSLVLGAAVGLERFYWYSWESNLSEDIGRAANASGRAYEQTVNWLVGAKIKECHTDDDRLWVCELSRDVRRAWLVWTMRDRRNWVLPENWALKEAQSLDGTIVSIGSAINIGPSPILFKTDHLPWAIGQ
jgi:hypothetical protein